MKSMPENVAYITSAKMGLATFVYREIDELTKTGLKITPFITKFGPGLYMPPSSWESYRINALRVILRQPLYFFRQPRKYVSSFYKAFKTASFLDFIIAADFSFKMRRRGITRIHCVEGLHSLFIGYYCKLLLGLPLSVMIYADSFYVNPKPKFTLKAYLACDRIITLCEFNKQVLLHQFGMPEERISVVRMAVDTGKFKNEKTTSVMIVGQYSERKGHDILFKAVKKLNRNDIRIWVVGKGSWGGKSDFADVPQLAKEIGVADQTIIWGKISEDGLRALYSSCDIFCLPSRTTRDGNKEGTPVAIMEAMSYSKPVISTRHAGIPEEVEEILVEEEDIDGVAKAIARLADDPELRAEMGRKNRLKIEREYSLSNILSMRETLLQP